MIFRVSCCTQNWHMKPRWKLFSNGKNAQSSAEICAHVPFKNEPCMTYRKKNISNIFSKAPAYTHKKKGGCFILVTLVVGPCTHLFYSTWLTRFIYSRVGSWKYTIQLKQNSGGNKMLTKFACLVWIKKWIGSTDEETRMYQMNRIK